MRVVFDTSVLVAAAHSRRGASFALIASIPSPHFTLCLSNTLYCEWQDVLTRPEHRAPGQSAEDVLSALRTFALHAQHQNIYFLWRPFLRDTDDDMIIELAFAARCRYIVTHNLRDFHGSEQLGLRAIAPGQFLALLKNFPTP